MYPRIYFMVSWLGATTALAVSAQPVCQPWGNIAGIHVDGEPMAFEASLRAVLPGWTGVVQSSKYNWEGKPVFTLEGETYTCAHALQGTPVRYTTRLSPAGRGGARAEIDLAVDGEVATEGVFFCIDLPAGDYAGATLEWLDGPAATAAALGDGSGGEVLRAHARGFRLSSPTRRIEVRADVGTELIVRRDRVDQPASLNDPHPRLKFVPAPASAGPADIQVYFTLLSAGMRPGATLKAGFTIQVDGRIDREPVTLALDATQPGRKFSGVSGNLRMQYPALDAQVVDYCLENLHVSWGRIAFPWSEWQTQESSDQAASVLAGGPSPFFQAQIAIARELARRRIPIIASVWNPPAWAVDAARPLRKGVKLDPARLQQSADSIANWLVFLKRHYGIEVALFSFNETDYGVEVHQDGAEHALANKILGTTFAARGLVTRLLVGDTGACTVESNRLVHPTQADASIRAHLGGIAFHTYHGVTPEALAVWAASSRAMNLPLLVTEGGPDSAAHRYPLIFVTPWFAQLEIDQYVRIAAACEPDTIMPWQFNADYSLLAGGGIYGDHGPLRPTQRFWSLKQLGTLHDAFWLPVAVDRPHIHAAALGDIAGGAYAVHVTNNGATRTATITGVSAGIRTMRVCVTDATRGMQTMGIKGVVDGRVTVQLESQTFTSLFSE